MAIKKTCPRGCHAAIDYLPNEKNRLVMVNTKQSTIYTPEGKVHKGYLPHSATCSTVRKARAQKRLPLGSVVSASELAGAKAARDLASRPANIRDAEEPKKKTEMPKAPAPKKAKAAKAAPAAKPAKKAKKPKMSRNVLGNAVPLKDEEEPPNDPDLGLDDGPEEGDLD